MSKVFEIGDVVELKSGSNPMTVFHVHGETISCRWQEEDSEDFKDKDFLAAELKIFVDPSSVSKP